MSKLQSLNAFLSERLTAVTVEIFRAVEKVLDEYQEEISRSKEENDRLRRLLWITPELKRSTIDSQQLSLPVSE
ncbi:hypothetical protein J4Q44_G00060910 [Coregonus suidteri]|uniref:Uncharacterized protein n=1 Tax=Coregonus suidteri TaxID=861788 RepID=A0AAN8RDW7_9TELE